MQTDKKIYRKIISRESFSAHVRQTYNNLRKCRPLPNESNERMWDTLSRRKLMEHRASRDPDQFPTIFISLDRVRRGSIASVVVVGVLHGLGFGEIIRVGGDRL